MDINQIDINQIMYGIAVGAIPVLFAVTLHEVAHGWVASLRGDPTAEMLGRLSLNPLKHIDPVGTILVPGLMLLFSPYLFGWAKPVPVSFNRLNHPKSDMIFVALAGPLANLLMAILWDWSMQMGIFSLHSAISSRTEVTMPTVEAPPALSIRGSIVFIWSTSRSSAEPTTLSKR